MENISSRKDRIKLSPEQLFQIYQECNAPGAPVKLILERHGLSAWHLVALRKKARQAILDAFSNTAPGRPKAIVPQERYQQAIRELENSKDALAAVGHELALLKKRVNSD